MKYLFFLFYFSSTAFLLDAYAKDDATKQANPIEAAYEVAQSIESPFLRTTALVEVGTAFYQIGETARSKEILDEVYQQTEKAGAGWHDLLLGEIVTANLQTGRMESAIDAITRIKEPLRKDASRSELAIDYARQEKVKEASQTTQTISDSATQTRTWVKLGKEFAQVGNFDGANQVYTSLKSTLGKADVLSAIGERYVIEGQPEKAFDVFLKIDGLQGKTLDEFAVHKVGLLSAITSEYRKRGDKLHTKEMLGRMAQISEEVLYDEVRVQALFETAIAYYDAGEEDEFLEFLSLSSEAAETTRDLNIKIDAFVKAFFWYEKIGDTDESYLIKFKLIELAKSRKKELQARNLPLTPTLRGDPYPYAKANEIMHIATQLLILGDEENALWFVKQLEDRFLPEGYTRLAEVQLNLKAPEKARQYLDQAMKFTVRVNWETEVVKSETLEKIALAYVGLGDGNRALEIAGTISNPFYQVRALSQIGVMLANRKAAPDSIDRM
ncbi:MAG: hypothetical protein HGB19_00950 [Chlorobiales bacterium]|nr:hypothetical protein [Chlorobiales bacterium]